VAVLSTDLAAAQVVLEKLLEEEPVDLEIPARDGAAAAEPPLVVVTETHPTVEVWKGSDDRIAQFLTAAMQENEIPIHIEILATKTRIYVSASNDKRARRLCASSGRRAAAITEGAQPEGCATGVFSATCEAVARGKLSARGSWSVETGSDWFRVHSGWAAAVAVCVNKGAPVVLARQRVHLVETFTYEFRQPYHTAEKMLLGQAARVYCANASRREAAGLPGDPRAFI